MRNLLYAAAALGGILAVVGVGVVAMAWLYPHHLIDTKGASVTPDDLITGYHVQLMGTLVGLMMSAAGMACAVFSFRGLERDTERMHRR